MTILEYFHEHWFLAFIALLFAYHLISAVLFRLPNRIVRHLNTRKAGWPPAHVDADGDMLDTQRPSFIQTHGHDGMSGRQMLDLLDWAGAKRAGGDGINLI